MNYYNYITETTSRLPDIDESDIIEEGVALDLFTKFADAKKYYKEKKYNLEQALDEGNIKEAKEIIKDLVEYLTKVGKEVKAMDDSAFTDRVGIFAIKTLEFFASCIGDILVGAGVDITKDVVVSVVKKTALTSKALAISGALGGLFAIAMPLYKNIKSQVETHEKMQYKIKREMLKNHKSEEEAKKAVGSIYKNEILDYLTDIINDLKKLDSGLKA